MTIKNEEEIDCWCGYKAIYHHTSTANRKDGKITVWYKCSDKHMTPLDVNYRSVTKEPIKKKKEKKDGKAKKTEVPTQ